MNKEVFLTTLRKKLEGLPPEDIKRSVDYYAEMIDDRMEDGKSEEEAVALMGSIDEIVSQIFMDTPLPKLVRAKAKPQRALITLEIVLLVLGFPLWFPLMIAAAVIVLSVYIVFWSIVISFYAAAISIGAGALACLWGTMATAQLGYGTSAVLFLGACFLLVGIAILLFLGSIALTRGVWELGKFQFHSLKRRFIGKRGENHA